MDHATEAEKFMCKIQLLSGKANVTLREAEALLRCYEAIREVEDEFLVDPQIEALDANDEV